LRPPLMSNVRPTRMQRQAIATFREVLVPASFETCGCCGSAHRPGDRGEVTVRLGRPSVGGRRTAGLARRSLRPRSAWAVRPLAASAPAGWRGEVAFDHGSSSAKVLVQFPVTVAPGRRRMVSVAAVQQLCEGRRQQWASLPATRAGRSRARERHTAMATVRFQGPLHPITLGSRQRPQPNPSIEGTSSSKLRLLPAAPHVKR
jgi:hypothetical protein